MFVDLETVDFGAILAQAKPYLQTVRWLADWEHEGFIGHAGGNLVFHAAEQWEALKSTLAAAGMADRNTGWSIQDKRKEDIAQVLRDLACDTKRGRLPSHYVSSQTDPETLTYTEVKGPDMSWSLRAKRWTVAVEMLESLQGQSNLFSNEEGTLPLDNAPPDPPLPATSHADDFTSVVWFGVRYEFAKGLQAESVRALWEAWKIGGHSLSEETIREKVNSGNDRFRLNHVFAPKDKSTGKRKAHPTLGTMIQGAGKGKYRLIPPDNPGITT